MDFLQQSAPPARYAIESDSEDDWQLSDSELHSLPRNHISKPLPIVTCNRTQSSDSLILAVGPAGLFWSTGLSQSSENSKIEVDGIQYASISVIGASAVVFASDKIPINALHAVSQILLAKIQPKKITIIDSYTLPGYISSVDIPVPPVRALATTADLMETAARAEVAPFRPPNMVQGLSASLLTSAYRQDLPAILYLLPLASQAFIVDYQDTFASPSPSANIINLAGFQRLANSTTWSRDLKWDLNRAPVKGHAEGGFGWLEEHRRKQARDLAVVGEGAMYL